jgi:hypothetical protein
VTAIHLGRDGHPCDEHPARVDDLLGLATLGAAAFSVMHDVASGLQALAAAIDELEALADTEGSEETRAAVAAASSALAQTNKMFVDARHAISGGNRIRDAARVDLLVQKAIDRADARCPPLRGAPTAEIAAVIPILTHVISSLIDTAAGSGHAEVTVTADGDEVEIGIRATEPENPPRSVGGTLAIAAGVIADHGGTLRCDRDAALARFAIRLPKRSG